MVFILWHQCFKIVNSVIFSNLSSASWWIWKVSSEHWTWGRNTLWIGCWFFIRHHTHSFKVNSHLDLDTSLLCFWEVWGKQRHYIYATYNILNDWPTFIYIPLVYFYIVYTKSNLIKSALNKWIFHCSQQCLYVAFKWLDLFVITIHCLKSENHQGLDDTE